MSFAAFLQPKGNLKLIIEKWKKKVEKVFLPLQSGDVPETYANVDDLVEQFHFSPSTSIEDGINRFVSWYRDYFKE